MVIIKVYASFSPYKSGKSHFRDVDYLLLLTYGTTGQSGWEARSLNWWGALPPKALPTPIMTALDFWFHC